MLTLYYSFSLLRIHLLQLVRLSAVSCTFRLWFCTLVHSAPFLVQRGLFSPPQYFHCLSFTWPALTSPLQLSDFYSSFASQLKLLVQKSFLWPRSLGQVSSWMHTRVQVLFHCDIVISVVPCSHTISNESVSYERRNHVSHSLLALSI